MNPKNILENLKCVGEFEAVRQTYYVYEGEEDYVLLSISGTKPHSGNVNFLPKEAVEYVIEMFAGEQRKTADDVFAKSTKHVLLRTRFDALNALYVICATNRGKKHESYKRPPLHFNIWAK